MQNVEKEGFAGLNSDDEDRAMPKGDYRSATNIRNGSSDTGSVGAIENLKGNTNIEDSLPTGNYSTIGAYEDAVGNSIIYFLAEKVLIPPPAGSPAKEDTIVWYGLIMRFFIDTEEIVTISRSTSFEFTEDSNIHSIDLVDDKLYWTDGKTEPKKININKGDNSSVPRKINIFFPGAYELFWDTNVYTGSIEVTDAFNNSAFTVYIPEIGGVPTTLDSFSSQAAAAINDQVEGDNTIVANACGSFLQIEFLNPGNSDIEFLTGGFDFLVVPDNFYKNINTDVVNQIKASPACQPSFELFANTARLSNYITKKNFQFAVRYVFDDNEKTTLSPYSLISYPEVSYGNPNENLNGIRIFYTDDRLLDVSSRAVIKQVELCFREGNGGKWKLIEALTEAEIGAKEVDHFFDFYNDEAYTFLPEAESNINYHEVPKKSDTQEFVENRLYHGGITRGFDPVCVEADINIGYNNPIEIPDTYSISGSILIKNKWKEYDSPSSEYKQQVIWQEEENGPIKFGGVDGNSKQNTDEDYDQGIPLGGFVVYLAGTDFYDITDQDVLAPAESVGNKGVYRAWSNSDKSDMETAIGNGPIYQRFEIKNVPPGKYMMRVASHKTTSDSLADGSYQNTSTTVSHDPRVSLVWGTEKIVHVVAGNETYDPAVEGFSVVDLSSPANSFNPKATVAYLTEDNDAGTFNPFGPPIELARLGWESGVNFNGLGFSSGPIEGVQLSFNKRGYTDHNGFFYVTANEYPEISVSGVISVNQPLSLNIFKSDGSSTDTGPGNLEGKTSTLYLQGSNTSLDSVSKVKIKGFVRNDAGFGAEGVVIVPTFARPTKTDANGNYSKDIYGDTYLYDATALPRRDPSVLTIGYPLWAEFSVDNSGYSPIGVGTNTGYYNVNNPFELEDNEITSSEVGGGSGFKRGYDGRFGIIYRDNGSRVSQVFTNESLQTHVNFYTERNEYGVQENYGKPSLEWSIAHKAPEWATNYQWVRTKNESALDFFQFAINEVVFSDENGATVPFASAVKVDMGLDNVSEYRDQNPGATVAIPASIDLSWRVRFINSAAGTYYDFFDEALVSTSGSVATGIAIAKNSEFEPQAGTLIEIYRPQRLSDTKLYYEFGECYEVINGFHQGPAKNQSEWEFTDNQWDTGNLSFIGNQDHDFVVGQVVDVYQSYPYTNGSYNGKATITEIPTSSSIVLDKAFNILAPTGLEGGVIIGRASGVFERGDSYYRTRSMTFLPVPNRVTKAIEDPNISDFYDSEHTDIGRLHIEAPLEKEKKEESLIVFSDFVDEASNINKLNDFIGVNSELLPIEYGSIRKLIKANNVLLSICELRTVSLYINEAVITSASGDDTLVATDKIIGNVRAMQDHYGTVNPESVCEREGTVVFWDGLKGSVIQVSSNGLFPISSIKMVKHFNDISKESLKSGKDMRVYGVHDQYFKDNLLIFKGVDGFVEPQTVVYSNQIKRWTNFRDYVPERVASTSMKLITFNDGKLYVHNSNPIHNNFYGTQYTSKIQTVSNENAKNIKVFRAMSYESNLPWSAPLITIPANNQYKLGMQSRLKAGKFINKEGIYYSEFLKDLNSPGFATEIEALIDGRDLRGKVLEVVLESDNTEHTVLFSLNVKSTLSEMSNR